VIATLAVENYRSLRHLIVSLTPLTVVTGANGTGKSSLYRALRLLADAARNGAVAALAREGGLPSTLWAGPEVIGRAVRDGTHPVQGTVRVKSVSLRLGFGGDDFSYAIDFGLPAGGGQSAFALDPEIKRESIWNGPLLRPAAVLCERDNGIVRIRGDRRAWSDPCQIRPHDSMLSEFADPRQAPEVLRVREQIRSWRFYDHIRTDAAAPARASQIGTRTPVMSQDGSDVAAALQTIRETGDGAALDQAVDLAFPGSRVTVEGEGGGRLGLRLHQHGLLRPLSAAELSDGTLRYLLWAAALLAPRPAGWPGGGRSGNRPASAGGDEDAEQVARRICVDAERLVPVSRAVMPQGRAQAQGALVLAVKFALVGDDGVQVHLLRYAVLRPGGLP